MASKIVVTGGAGFIGASLVRALIGRGDEVRVIDSGVATGLRNLEGISVSVHRADVRDADVLENVMDGASAVVHLAARTSVPSSISDPRADFDTNVVGTFAVLEAARNHGVQRVVVASSNAVVAGNPPPANEQLMPRPLAPYGAAKAAGEAYVAAYHRAYGMETVALRFANAYGPWSAHKTSVVASFVRAGLAGGPLIVRGDGRQTRDFVHIDDIVAAICACLDVASDALSGTVYQIGTGVETSLLELAQAVAATSERAVEIVHEPASPGDSERNVSDIGRAEVALGYRPGVALEDGVRRTVEWFAALAAQTDSPRQ